MISPSAPDPTPLALGVVDLFHENGLRIWGPNRKAAQFEASKVFSQLFMQRHGIPTAGYAEFTAAMERRVQAYLKKKRAKR